MCCAYNNVVLLMVCAPSIFFVHVSDPGIRLYIKLSFHLDTFDTTCVFYITIWTRAILTFEIFDGSKTLGGCTTSTTGLPKKIATHISQRLLQVFQRQSLFQQTTGRHSPTAPEERTQKHATAMLKAGAAVIFFVFSCTKTCNVAGRTRHAEPSKTAALNVVGAGE